jgi:hypothetical protein
LSSFKRINDLDNFGIDETEVDPDVITLAEDQDTIQLYGRRYRKANFSTQDHIYHYLFSQKECRKVYLHSRGWFVECKPHDCPMACKDSKQKT